MLLEAGTVSLNAATITIQVCVEMSKHYRISTNLRSKILFRHFGLSRFTLTNRENKVVTVSEAHSRNGCCPLEYIR